MAERGDVPLDVNPLILKREKEVATNPLKGLPVRSKTGEWAYRDRDYYPSGPIVALNAFKPIPSEGPKMYTVTRHGYGDDS